MNNQQQQKTAIIIGAGPAGLTGAYQLLKETDIRPIILEKSDYVGGISRTIEYKGNRMDIGGHRFFSKNKQINELWNTLMPMQGSPSIDDIKLGRVNVLTETGPDPEKIDEVMLIRNRVSRIYYLKKFFDYPISIKLATFINMGLFRTIKAGFGYLKASMNKRQERSLEDFYINRFGHPLYKMFFEDYTEKLWGVHPSNISPAWGSQRVKELSLSKAVKEMLTKAFNKNYKAKETSLIDQFLYPKKGPGQLWEIMAEDIIKMGGEIHFGTEVTGININGNAVDTVVMKKKDSLEDTLHGDLFFSTMSVKDLIHAMGEAVPAEISDIAAKLPYRDFITAGLLVKKLKITNMTNIKTIGNIIPDCWIYIQERDVKIGRLQIFNNWSPYLVKDYENTVWLGLEYFCTEDDEVWNMDREKFIAFAINELARIDVINKEDVLDSAYYKVEKAYPAYFGTYSHFDQVKEFLNQFDNLYCLGRNGQHRYNNMDHSMLTAIEAVNNIKTGNKDKSTVWNVNTEYEYHEKIRKESSVEQYQ